MISNSGTLTKMAASGTPLGYEYVFVDPVPDDFYCKQCSLVARRLTITSCCGESYCNGCIHSTQQDNQPCPGCGQESFETLQHVKYQKKILSLSVHCSLKEKGCGWCGPLEHLDAHLDPDTGDCEFTDTPCPLKCQQKVSKKNLEHHLTKECVKRDYVCPYCSFKASYEIVTDSHWPECKYYPLVCPNRCGVTCERPTMEDHLKICRLQQVECQFKQIGCLEKFSREDSEEHMREKAQTHLTMMAATSVKMQQEFQTKLQEQEGRFEEKQAEFQQEQEGRFEEKQAEFQQEQEGRFEEKQAALEQEFEQKQTAQDQEFLAKLSAQEEKFQAKLQELEGRFKENALAQIKALKKQIATDQEEFRSSCGLSWKFTMEGFNEQKAAGKNLPDCGWYSPPMYTRLCGYKFCIGIDANGYGDSYGKSVNVELWKVKGEYDDQLKWPVIVTLTLELINHFENGENKICTATKSCTKPTHQRCYVTPFLTVPGKQSHFISHSELPLNPVTRTHFLKDNALHFKITHITMK